jgi:guanylate kinase
MKKENIGIDANPLVVVISGPSGVGKDATLAKIKETGARFHYIVTATTRRKRVNEINGVDYYFITHSDFETKIREGKFLEYANVYNNYYGVLKKEVQDALKKGEDVIFKVDVQGATTLKQKIPAAIFIFLMPSSTEELMERLRKRNADSEQDVDLRISKAETEINNMEMFDYVVVNHQDNLDQTAEKVKSIVTAEKCRINRRKVHLK